MAATTRLLSIELSRSDVAIVAQLMQRGYIDRNIYDEILDILRKADESNTRIEPAELADTLNQKGELQMSATIPTNTSVQVPAPLVLTTQVNLNGRDITTYRDQDLYALISEQEAQLKVLEAIAHKPAKLKAHIDAIETALLELITYLDKNNPTSSV
jgi:hypothetical protein